LVCHVFGGVHVEFPGGGFAHRLTGWEPDDPRQMDDGVWFRPSSRECVA
jgi:hypothetical protein